MASGLLVLQSIPMVGRDGSLRASRVHVVVQDRAMIEAPLLATKIAPVVPLDIDGNPK